MRFASADLVYPMRMSKAAKDTQSVRTYVLGRHRVERTDPTAGEQATVTFAGTVPTAEVESEQLRTALAAAPYLTTFDQVFTDPGSQIVSDFSFSDAASDEGYPADLHRRHVRHSDRRRGPAARGAGRGGRAALVGDCSPAAPSGSRPDRGRAL